MMKSGQDEGFLKENGITLALERTLCKTAPYVEKDQKCELFSHTFIQFS